MQTIETTRELRRSALDSLPREYAEWCIRRAALDLLEELSDPVVSQWEAVDLYCGRNAEEGTWYGGFVAIAVYPNNPTVAAQVSRYSLETYGAKVSWKMEGTLALSPDAVAMLRPVMPRK